MRGDFVWHSHSDTDDFILVVDGRMVVETRDEAWARSRRARHRPARRRAPHACARGGATRWSSSRGRRTRATRTRGPRPRSRSSRWLIGNPRGPRLPTNHLGEARLLGLDADRPRDGLRLHPGRSRRAPPRRRHRDAASSRPIPDLLEGVSALHIALTHFHLDHVAGLVGLPGLAHLERRELWAPGRSSRAHRRTRSCTGCSRRSSPSRPGHVTSQLLTRDPRADRRRGDRPPGPLPDRGELPPPPRTDARLQGARRPRLLHGHGVRRGRADFVRGATVLLHEASTRPTRPRTRCPRPRARRRDRGNGRRDRLVIRRAPPLLTDEEALLAPARARFASSEVGVDGPVQGFAA